MNKIRAVYTHTFAPFVQSCVKEIAALVSPPFCVVCKTLTMKDALYTFLCSACNAKIMPVVSVQLPIVGKQTIKVFAISAYQEPLKQLILAKRYSDIAISCLLGHLLWDKTYMSQAAPDFFVPIPLHWRRYAQRGYNQAHEMAQMLTQKSGKPTVHLLVRCKNTSFQFGLSSILRKQNLSDAFVLNPRIDKTLYEDKHIVLVDDLMTTGVTLAQAARVLLALKPKSISAVVVCRVI